MFTAILTRLTQSSLHRNWEKTARCHFHYGRPEFLDVLAEDDEDEALAQSLALSTSGLVWGAHPELAIPIEEGLDLLARNQSERLVSVVYTDL